MANGQDTEVFTLNEALALLQEELKQVKSAVSHIDESKAAASQAVNAAEKLKGIAVHLLPPVKELLETIDQVDFPSRLDKLDATTSTIGIGMQNLQRRIDMLEQQLKGDMQEARKESRSIAQELARRINGVAGGVENANTKGKTIEGTVRLNRILLMVIGGVLLIQLVLMFVL